MKNKTTTVLLTFFLGAVGAHWFYLGRSGKGVLYLLTLGLLGIGALIDFVVLLTMDQATFDQKYNGGDASVPVAFQGSTADELKKLHELKSAGIITEAEFEQKSASFSNLFLTKKAG